MYVRPEFTLEGLFRAHYERLCAYGRKFVGCPDVAEDLVQDVFAHLCSKDRGSTCLLMPRRYLYTAVRNRALKHLERERVVRRSRAIIQGGGHPPGMGRAPPNADRELEAAELVKAFDQAVDRLPPRCREAYLHSRSGMNHAQVAAVMGTSARTVETQMARARQHLRRELEPWL